MKTFLLLLLSGLFFCATASAQEYQRKKIMPQYFIPKKDIEHKKQIQKPANMIKNAKAGGIVADEDKKMSNSKDDDMQNLERNDNNPDFLEIFDEYRNDINKISNSKEYPDTSQIKKDYQGMNTNDAFLVE